MAPTTVNTDTEAHPERHKSGLVTTTSTSGADSDSESKKLAAAKTPSTAPVKKLKDGEVKTTSWFLVLFFMKS